MRKKKTPQDEPTQPNYAICSRIMYGTHEIADVHRWCLVVCVCHYESSDEEKENRQNEKHNDFNLKHNKNIWTKCGELFGRCRCNYAIWKLKKKKICFVFISVDTHTHVAHTSHTRRTHRSEQRATVSVARCTLSIMKSPLNSAVNAISVLIRPLCDRNRAFLFGFLQFMQRDYRGLRFGCTSGTRCRWNGTALRACIAAKWPNYHFFWWWIRRINIYYPIPIERWRV